MHAHTPEKGWDSYEGPRFTVNSIATRAGSFYEKIRYLIDYKDEHTIRRAAIERILRRLELYEDVDKMGRILLEELVRAGYIRSDTLPEALADEAQVIIHSYNKIEKLQIPNASYAWTFAAIEIDELLFSPQVDKAVVEAFFNTVVEAVQPKDAHSIDQKQFRMQLYVACRRAILKDNVNELTFAAFVGLFPEWKTIHTVDDGVFHNLVSQFSEHVDLARMLVDSQINWRISGRLKNYGIYFSIIRDIVSEHRLEAKEIFEDPEVLAAKVRAMLSNIYAKHNATIQRSGTRAIFYILITKILIGVGVELPYDIFVIGHINYVALAINVIAIPALLWLMVKTVRYPSTANTERIVIGIENIIRDPVIAPVYISTEPRPFTQKLGFAVFYLIFFSITFGVLLWVTRMLEFNIVSIGLFFFFLTIVSYLGLRIRHKATEWVVVQEDDRFIPLVWHLLTFPIFQTGRWVASKLASINIFILIMDFVLETPFKIILGSFDSFVSYVKETRKDTM